MVREDMDIRAVLLVLLVSLSAFAACSDPESVQGSLRALSKSKGQGDDSDGGDPESGALDLYRSSKGGYDLMIALCRSSNAVVEVRQRVAVLKSLAGCLEDEVPHQVFSKALSIANVRVGKDEARRQFEKAVFAAARYIDGRMRLSGEVAAVGLQEYVKMLRMLYNDAAREIDEEGEPEGDLFDAMKEYNDLNERFRAKVVESYAHVLSHFVEQFQDEFPAASPGAIQSDDYWAAFEADYQFQLSLVHYLDNMKHPSRWAIWTSFSNQDREESWLAYRRKIVALVHADVKRMEEYRIMLEREDWVDNLEGCSEAARTLNTRVEHGQCQEVMLEEACKVECRCSYGGVEEHDAAAQAALEDFIAMMEMCEHHYPKKRVESLVTRAYEAMSIFSDTFVQRCPKDDLTMRCIREMEVLMLLFHSTQFLGNTLHELMMDKLGNGFPMDQEAGYPAVARYKFGEDYAEMRRKFLLVPYALTPQLEKVEIPIRVDVVMHDDFNMDVAMRWDVLEKMRLFLQDFTKDMIRPEYTLAGESPLYDSAKSTGRVYHLTGYEPGTVLGQFFKEKPGRTASEKKGVLKSPE